LVFTAFAAFSALSAFAFSAFLGAMATREVSNQKVFRYGEPGNGMVCHILTNVWYDLMLFGIIPAVHVETT
jgi:hypothetical protein